MAPSIAARLAAETVARRGRHYAALTGEQVLEEARRGHAVPRPVPEWAPADHELSATAGFPVHVAGAADGIPVLYLHGGAYTIGFQKQHWRLIRRIAGRAGAQVYAPDYPLAPEQTWRDSLPQLVALCERLGIDVVAGDSAGGGYALAVAQALVAAGRAPSASLISPWADLTGSLAEVEPYAGRDRWLTMNRLRACAAAWSDGDPARPEASPLFGDFTGIRRLQVFAATGERLYPEAAETVARARSAGVPTEFAVAELLPHVYPLLPIPEARPAVAAIVRFVRDSAP